MYIYQQRRTQKENDLLAMEFMRSNLTQTEFARRKGLSKGTLCKILNNRGIRGDRRKPYTIEEKKAYVKEFIELKKSGSDISATRFKREHGLSNCFHDWLWQYQEEVQQEEPTAVTEEPKEEEKAPVKAEIKEDGRHVVLRMTSPSFRIECYKELSAEEIIALSEYFSKMDSVSR